MGRALDSALERLSRDLAGQPEGSVLAALRADPELASWGWTDARLTQWAREIAGNQQARYAPPTGALDD